MAIDVNIATTFLGNTDTPDSYAGMGGYVPSVNVGETGLEFRLIEPLNIMNSNLVADADRSQNMLNHSMTFINGKQFKWTNGVAPTIGQGSFEFQGYGTNASDVLYRLKDGGGTVRNTVYGNGRQVINFSDIRALKITENDYAIGVDGNGYMTFSAPNINGVITGHRMGYVDTSGVFTELLAYVSNQSFNQMRMQSRNGQVFNMINWQDHNGNIRFGFNPQTSIMHIPAMPTYADNAAALAGNLVAGDEYKTATGERRIVV